MTKSIVSNPGFGVVAGAAWVATYFVSRMILKTTELSQSTKILVAIAPALPCALFLLIFMKNIKNLDELGQKVQMEALAFAFPLSVFLLMFLGLLQLAIDLSPDNWSYRHVWIFLPLFYFAGLALASRRYK
jgi:hypothetical protein